MHQGEPRPRRNAPHLLGLFHFSWGYCVGLSHGILGTIVPEINPLAELRPPWLAFIPTQVLSDTLIRSLMRLRIPLLEPWVQLARTKAQSIHVGVGIMPSPGNGGGHGNTWCMALSPKTWAAKSGWQVWQQVAVRPGLDACYKKGTRGCHFRQAAQGKQKSFGNLGITHIDLTLRLVIDRQSRTTSPPSCHCPHLPLSYPPARSRVHPPCWPRPLGLPSCWHMLCQSRHRRGSLKWISPHPKKTTQQARNCLKNQILQPRARGPLKKNPNQKNLTWTWLVLIHWKG